MPTLETMPEALKKAQLALAQAHEQLVRTTTSRQRLWMGIALAGVLATAAGLGLLSMRVEWRSLYTGLDPKEAQQAAAELGAEKIPYQFDADGTTLRVPAKLIDKARLGLATKGLPQSGRLGFELFDKPNWVGSEFDEKVNYQRALEGELEHTIASMGAIQSARVHLVLQHESLFAGDERAAKASVIIKLSRRGLSDTEADAIRTLVASAVDGLDPSHVTLVDAEGRLSFGPRNVQAETALYEQMLSERLIATLEPIAGKNNIRASVNVDYDTSNQEETQETYDPKSTVVVAMQRSAQSTGAQNRTSGIPGAASNAPNGGGATDALSPASSSTPLFPPLTGPGESSQQESNNYLASKRTRHVVQGPGQVKRITVAILVNDRLSSVGTGKQAQLKFVPRTAEEVKRMEELARTAVGFDAARGDQIAVENLAFADNVLPTTPTTLQRLMPEKEQVSAAVWLIGPIACVLLLFFLVVRPATKHMSQQIARTDAVLNDPATLPLSQPNAAELSAQETPQALPRSRLAELSEALTQRMMDDPAPVVHLVKSWINEGEAASR